MSNNQQESVDDGKSAAGSVASSATVVPASAPAVHRSGASDAATTSSGPPRFPTAVPGARGDQRRAVEPLQTTTTAPRSPVADENDFRMPSSRGVQRGSTGDRATDTQRRIEIRQPRPLNAKLAKVGKYEPTGVKIDYNDNKVGITPDVDLIIATIAENAGVDTNDSSEFSKFVETLVADIYVNAYSDKQSFMGEARHDGYALPRQHIKDAIEPIVGTMHRRFARAMAPIMVSVMRQSSTFDDLLDRRCTELNLSTRAEAIYQFDGNEGLTLMDRQAGQRAAEKKHLAIARQNGTGQKPYTVSNSSDYISAAASATERMPPPMM